MKKIFVFLLLSLSMCGQSYSLTTRNHPPCQDWHYLETDNYRLIYPSIVEEDAIRMVSTLEHIRPYLAHSLSVETPKIDIILSNRGSNSNGYAALAPRMSGWYNTPPQHYLLGTNEWFNLLAIHEMRHINQFAYTNKGLIKTCSIIFGEYGHAIPMFAFFPGWYFEGDAVLTETLLSKSGRGRMPKFSMPIRANRLCGKKQNYYQAYLGSLNDYSPNIYDLGYLMISHLRREYGNDTLLHILNRTSNRAFWPYAFSRASKHYIDLNEKGIYDSTMAEVEAIWIEQDKKIKPSVFQNINKRKNDIWTNYNCAYQVSDSNFIAMKSGLSDIRQLIEVDLKGNERLISFFSPSYRVNYKNGKIVYSETVRDIRYGAQNYKNITILDINTGEINRLTSKTRYFAPAFSNDGKKICAVEFTPERKCNLLILNSETGEILDSIPNPDNYFISMPSWSDNDTKIVFTRQKYKGKSLTIYDLENQEYLDLIPSNHENFNSPIFYEDYVFYQSPYSGIDNVYAININNMKKYRITNSRFGTMNHSVYKNNEKHYLIYSDYTASGFNIAQIEIKPKEWQPIDEVPVDRFEYFEPLLQEELTDNAVDPDEIEEIDFEKGKYHPITHSLNFHSWLISPFYPYLGANISSDDIMHSTIANVGGYYNVERGDWNVSSRIIYSGIFPILSLEGGYGERYDRYIDEEDNEIDDEYSELYGEFALSIPLDLSVGSYYRIFEMESNIEYNYIQNKNISEEYELSNGVALPIEYEVSLRNYRKMAARDINPAMGGMINLSYRHTPFESDYNGSRAFGTATVFMPGFGKHHSFYLIASRQLQEPDNYRFHSEALIPRGYDDEYHKMISTISLNYELPLCYPEFALGSIMYIKRLRTGMFYDHCYYRDLNLEGEMRSIGCSLTMDCAFFAKPMTLPIGFFYTYKIDEEKHHFGISMMNIGMYEEMSKAFRW